MSKAGAVEYLKKLDEDANLKKKILFASSSHARMAIVKRAGFDFTRSELREALREEIIKGYKERRILTDAELAKITGG